MTHTIRLDNKRWKRRSSLCVDCPRQTAVGKIRCALCLEKNAKSSRDYRAKNRDERNKFYSARKVQRKADGRCPICSVPMDADADISDKTGEMLSRCQNCREVT